MTTWIRRDQNAPFCILLELRRRRLKTELDAEKWSMLNLERQDISQGKSSKDNGGDEW